MHVEPHLPLEELKRLERVEKDADRARRMRIIILGIAGWTAPAVAMAVGTWLIFGIYPAQKAAKLDPITAMRME